jgi:hypothetical protein
MIVFLIGLLLNYVVMQVHAAMCTGPYMSETLFASARDTGLGKVQKCAHGVHNVVELVDLLPDKFLPDGLEVGGVKMLRIVVKDALPVPTAIHLDEAVHEPHAHLRQRRRTAAISNLLGDKVDRLHVVPTSNSICLARL